jgi:hypothetical protein
MDERDEMIAALYASSRWSLDEFLKRYHEFLEHLARHEEAQRHARASSRDASF